MSASSRNRSGSLARKRDLFVQYTSRPHDPAVTYAIATGIIDRRDVPDELLEHLARALEFYAHAPCEE